MVAGQYAGSTSTKCLEVCSLVQLYKRFADRRSNHATFNYNQDAALQMLAGRNDVAGSSLQAYLTGCISGSDRQGW